MLLPISLYQGHPKLLDYAATKVAITSFTRSLAPVWTPLIPASFGEEKVESFGSNTALGRVGHPEEIAFCYLFVACNDSSYMTGQVLHPNGGRIVNG